MNNKERIRASAEAKLARMKPHKGHARRLRAKLGITDAPAPKVEPVVEKKPRKKRTKKTTEQ